MAIKKYYATKDNTLNAFENNLLTRANRLNMGAADIPKLLLSRVKHLPLLVLRTPNKVGLSYSFL